MWFLHGKWFREVEMSKLGSYLIVQEDILRDAKIRDLIESMGYEGFGIYISILTLMRNYSDTGYKVPWIEVRKISRWDLLMPEEELKRFIDSCIECNLFKADDRYFWSERRRNALLEQQESLKETSERNKKNIQKRWEKKDL